LPWKRAGRPRFGNVPIFVPNTHMIFSDRAHIEVMLQDRLVYAQGYFTAVIWRNLKIEA